ncbi:MAG: sugar phosphate isomerase/epimerase [Planctomycetes bacterium]|nr:sugar phosphate isomerase/epimerase [Planctomycetota bacterium]
MKYGVNMLLWCGSFERKHLKFIRRAADLGFDGVEFAFFTPDTVPVKETAAALKDHGLEATSCTVLGPQTSIISDNRLDRDRGVEHLRRVVDLNAAIGAKILCGPLYAPVGIRPPADRNPPGRIRREWDHCAASLGKVARHAARAGISLDLEPLNRFETYFLNTVEDTVKLCRDIGEPNVRVHLDTFHANIEEKDFAGAARKAGKWLHHVHCCENDRGIPGSGHVDWYGVMRTLKALRYDGWLTIESFVPAVKEIAAATAIWRPLAPSGDELARQGLRFLKKLAR